MIRPRIGMFLDNGRLTVVAITGRRRIDHFVVEGADDPAATLAAELQARGLNGRVRVGLDRRPAVVKTIELPRAPGGDLAGMVAFELERHVPFRPEDVRFDWVELAGEADEPHRVLVAAVERRTLERARSLLTGAHRQPAAIVVACHELPSLLARPLPERRAVWVHRQPSAVDLLFLDGSRLLMSRRVSPGDGEELAREIARSLPMVRWSSCGAVWTSGTPDEAAGATLSAQLGAPVSAPPYSVGGAGLVAALPPGEEGSGLLALAVAAGARIPSLDLLPAAARPWTPGRGQLVTAGIVGITALLGLALALTHVSRTERYLDRLDQEIRGLDPQVKAVDRLAVELGRKRSLLTALQDAQGDGVPALPALRELTETLPTGAWLQALTMDRQGVELVGQSDAASALIPLLEASSRLERVEFTSPVTKTQGKDQFRIRAAWEDKGR